jgi:hypothetical protein
LASLANLKTIQTLCLQSEIHVEVWQPVARRADLDRAPAVDIPLGQHDILKSYGRFESGHAACRADAPNISPVLVVRGVQVRKMRLLQPPDVDASDILELIVAPFRIQ